MNLSIIKLHVFNINKYSCTGHYVESWHQQKDEEGKASARNLSKQKRKHLARKLVSGSDAVGIIISRSQLGQMCRY